MKKTLALFLCAALFLAVLLPAGFAFAFVRTGEGEAPLLQEGDFDLITAEESHYDSLSLRVQSGVEQAIYNDLKNALSSINISSYNIPLGDIDTLYAKVINDNPDLFYVSSSYSFDYYPSTGCVANVFPCYAEMEESIQEAQAIFDAGVAEALTQVDSSMSDEQKVVVLHDYICSEAIYPVLQQNQQGELLNDQNIWHSAYGFFKNKVAVCAGYTLAFSYLLNQLGIESEYVSSDPMTHAWNKVKLDGSWYNVDITFDNHDNAQGVNTYGCISHAHLLKSDSYFSAESGSCHFGGETYDDTSATSTAYDNAFWNDLPCSRIYAINGDYYFLNPYNQYRVFLTKRSSAGTNTNIGNYYSTAGFGYTTRVYDENGVLHSITRPDSLARLVYLDNRFYIVAGTNIYSSTLTGTRYNILSNIAEYSNGLGVDEDGNLIYQPYTDSTQVNTLDKEEYFFNYMTISKDNNTYHNYPDINLDGIINAKDYGLIVQDREQ